MQPEERRILIVSCFGHFMSHFSVMVVPAIIIPLAASMNLSVADILGLTFPQYLLFGLTALPWGLAGDRIGGKPLMVSQLMGSGVCGLLAAGCMNSSTGLAAALAGVGLFSGIYHPIGTGMISKAVNRLNVGMGYNAMFGTLGMAAAPLVAGLVNWWSGPAMVFVVLGALNLAGVLLMQVLPFKERRGATAKGSPQQNARLTPFLVLLLANMLGGIVFSGATVVLTAYLETKSHGILGLLTDWSGFGLSSNLLATWVTALGYVVGMLGQYAGARAGERYDTRYAYLAFHAMSVPLAFAMAFAHDFSLVGLTFAYFFFQLGMQPSENTLVARFSPEKMHHSAYGMKFVLTFGVGALAVKMMQWIERNAGLEVAFLVLAGVSLMIVSTILTLIRVSQPEIEKQVDYPEHHPVVGTPVHP